MLKEDVERIIDLIVEKTSMKRDEILDLVKRKMEEFEGLIDEHAAIYMIAKELGVQVSDEQKVLVTPLKIKDLVHGLRNVTICARVLSVMPVRKYVVNGKEVSVVKVLLVDETGTIPLTLWNEKIEIAKALKPNSLVMVTRATVKKFKKSLELSLTNDSEVKLVDEKTVRLPSISKLTPKKYKGETITIRVDKVLESPVFSRKMGRQRTVICVRGRQIENNKKVRVIAWDSLTESLNSVSLGDVIKVINAKLLSTDHELNEYLLTKWSIIESVGKTHIEEEGVTKALSSISGQAKGLDIEGYLGYMELRGTQRLRLMLHDFRHAVFLDLSSSLASRLLHKMFDQHSPNYLNLFKYKIRVDDVDVTRINDLLELKANIWSPISLTESRREIRYARRMFIRELTGGFAIRATVLRANLKLAVYNPLKGTIKRDLTQENLENCVLISSLRLLLEDGISQALAFTNSWDVISYLLDISRDEVLELAHSPKVLKEIIGYTEEELEGREYVFSGLAVASRKGNKILLLTDVEPINLSYEIKLLKEYVQRFEEVKRHGEKEEREKKTSI